MSKSQEARLSNQEKTIKDLQAQIKTHEENFQQFVNLAKDLDKDNEHAKEVHGLEAKANLTIATVALANAAIENAKAIEGVSRILRQTFDLSVRGEQK